MTDEQRPSLRAFEVYWANPGLLPFLIITGALFLAAMISDQAMSGADIGTVLLFFGALAVAGLCCVWIVRGIARAQSVLRAVRRGDRVQARVASIYETRTRASGRDHYLWTMTWEGEDDVSGHAVPAPRSRFEAFSVGDSITLWRDPRTGRVFWPGDL